ncbi:leukocyte receptor cluster member 9 isoform X1 [Anguilla rostrata]|uniref:leukocyte receptor cluster member 9 isoform X1 n=2 Tax=Anguilla rostrata TaxID=7938 RepID=UPI0030CDEEE3
MAAERASLPCGSDEDLRTRPLDEHMSSNVGESLNPGETVVGRDNKAKPQDDLSGNNVCGQEVDGVAICQFFLLGRCHFGNKCRLSHSLPQSASNVPESRHDTEQDAGNRKKVGKMKKMQKRGKNVKEVEGKEYTKKPRMRTADDVISRILWDPSLDPTDFSVGYLDRFLGVLERPFSEFSWDTDICSCDYSEELALPRHRFQYFTYRGRRVWDRESRMDGVFGSTGGPLEPPFAAGGEKEEGNVSQEARPQESGGELHETCDELREESTSGHAGEARDQDSFHMHPGVDEEKETGDLSHTLAEVAGDPQSSQKCFLNDTPQGTQTAGVESETCEKEAVDVSELSMSTAEMSVSERGNANREGSDGEQEEWKEEWEEEEKEQLSWQLWSSSKQGSRSPVETEKQSPVFRGGARSEPLGQRQRPSRGRPTHFITFRADTPTLLSGLQGLREEITSLFPCSAPHWVSPESLHITLSLLVLSGPEEVSRACKILREFAQKRSQPPLSLSFPPKLDHFGGRVLFLTPQPLSGLQSLNRPLQEVYGKQGWLHRDSVSPNYHLTLAKMKGNEGERVFKGVVDMYSVARLRAIDFGKLVVNQLCLCVNGKSKMEDGFYETLCVVNLQ